jgi:multidrug efflux pump subunit AcrA (membrane-fusion protein)
LRLVAQNAIPRKQLDNDLAMLAANQAQLDASKAQMVQAQLNLAWTKVYSPIDGIAGNAASQIGELVGPTTKMMTVSQVHPIWAYFNISEVAYLANARQTIFPTSIKAASFSLAARSLRRRARCSWPRSFPIKRDFYVRVDLAGFVS